MLLTVDGVTVEIPLMNYLQSLEAEVSETAGGTMKVTLFDPDQDALEDMLLGLRSDSSAAVLGPDKDVNGKYVQIQFGWDDGNVPALPRWAGVITSYTPTYEAQGTTLEFDTVSQGMVKAAIDRSKPRDFPAGLTASAVFQRIAKSNGWTATVVEESVGVLDAASSNQESDTKFIRDKILPRAVNREKRPFVFYADFDGTMHFHTSGYQNGSTADGVSLDADYLFAQDAMGDVESFAPSDGVLAAQVFGAGNAQYTGADAGGGKQLGATASATENPVGASLATVGDGVYRPTIGNQINARLYIPSRDPAEFEQRVAHRWGQVARASYTATLKVRGTHAMRVGGWVRVRRLRRDGREHHLSGVFLVTKLRHSFGDGWSTEVEMVRTGTGYSPGIPVGAGVLSKPGVVDAATQTSQGGEPAGPQESFAEARVE